ncbi:MAG: hypothetical protein ACWA5A_08520 [Marinibacterium sp.]
MDSDLALVLGLVVAGFSFPGMMSAISERRAPRASMLTILIAGGLIYFALSTKPGGYELRDVPDAFIDVIARFIN